MLQGMGGDMGWKLEEGWGKHMKIPCPTPKTRTPDQVYKILNSKWHKLINSKLLI